MDFFFAPDIQKRLGKIVLGLGLNHVDIKKIKCFRSRGSKSKAQARIWSFPKVWQLALNLGPNYVVEVISEKFDKLNTGDQEKVLIHELLHIPKNFSGSLLSHRGRGRVINSSVVNLLFEKLNLKNCI